jgi:hypothetical protein
MRGIEIGCGHAGELLRVGELGVRDGVRAEAHRQFSPVAVLVQGDRLAGHSRSYLW